MVRLVLFLGQLDLITGIMLVARSIGCQGQLRIGLEEKSSLSRSANTRRACTSILLCSEAGARRDEHDEVRVLLGTAKFHFEE